MIDWEWHNTLIKYLNQLANNQELVKRTEYLTIHASNWRKAIKEFLERRKELRLKTKILAITALTNLSDDDTQEIYGEDAKHTVLKLTKLALESWIDGVVCSPEEAPMLRAVFWYDFDIVTPWIRFEWSDKGDQKRVTTPAQAIKNWATAIVMWRDILKWTSEEISEAIERVIEEVTGIVPEIKKWEFEFEKLLYNWEWLELLKHIWAFYQKPEWWKYCRLASWLLSDWYINIWASERNNLVLKRWADELAKHLKEKEINADVVMWAQMWSVRLSSYLGGAIGVESIYSEKEWDDMILKRHNIDLKWQKVVLSEDIITKGSTIKKMIELVETGWWKVVAITCIWNRLWEDNFEWIPLISCFTPPEFGLYYDETTPPHLQESPNATKLPEGANIAEKPKHEWKELVRSMRDSKK
jgi:orotidine-5'-phosphate decarboxylase/orotate phosphoribosyltransferase